MTDAPLTIIEPGIGGWRSADIGEDGLPSDLRFHDDSALSALDGVFAARITRLDKPNDLAFADLGGGLTGCLNLRRAKQLVRGQAQTIADCVREGERLMVQVVAEPSSSENKAVTITPRPRLLGRYVVVEAGAARLNFSKDLPPKAIKALKPLLEEAAGTAAIIVRSAAASVPAEAVAAEAAHLVTALSQPVDAPGRLYAASPLEQALLSAPYGEDLVIVEGGSALAEARALATTRWPDLTVRLEAYRGDEPAFEAFGVEEAIEEALAPRIELPSGGWISITETPAMTVIDVNMGSALKGRSASEAKVLVNLEAALAALYHLRFQDIGGLVVIDFIDMTAKGAARELISLIEQTARQDRVPLQHTGLSSFGLVELARKRRGRSLKDRMQRQIEPRPRADMAALDLLRRGSRIGKGPDAGALVLSGPDTIIGWLKANPGYLSALEQDTKRPVELLLGTRPDVFLRG